jgi:CRP/FNR family transcriptional regulator, anaerobic regulatory protein
MEMSLTYPAQFEPGLTTAMSQVGLRRHIAAGDKLLDVGDPLVYMPVVLAGALKVLRIDEEGRELLLYYVAPGEGCAMTFTCCMQAVRSEVRVVAEDDTELLLIPLVEMESWMMQFPSWKKFVMETIRSRFHELLHAIDQIAFERLDSRLVSYLKEKAKVTGSRLLNLSHEQIAQELATSRVVISRLLKRLELDGKLLLYRQQIRLLRKL